MLDWLFRRSEERASAASPDKGRADEVDALPAWLCVVETWRDWDVLGEPSHRGMHAQVTELPAWRQSEAQLDALLSTSFWELERDGTAAQQPTARDGDSEPDAEEQPRTSRREPA